jgi:hypothetical protein
MFDYSATSSLQDTKYHGMKLIRYHYAIKPWLTSESEEMPLLSEDFES